MRYLPVLVLTALLLTHGTAAADWLSLRSDHFQVIGNTTAGRLRDVAVRLEQFREVVGQLNPAVLREESAPPVVVLVFRDARTYEPFMPRNNGQVVRAGGFFQSGQDVNYITLNVQAGQGAFHVVFHEYAHLLLRGVFADAPVWFNEGLAEYLQHRRGDQRRPPGHHREGDRPPCHAAPRTTASVLGIVCD